MAQPVIQLRYRPGEEQKAHELLQLLDLYRAQHKLARMFDAVWELVKNAK